MKNLKSVSPISKKRGYIPTLDDLMDITDDVVLLSQLKLIDNKYNTLK